MVFKVVNEQRKAAISYIEKARREEIMFQSKQENSNRTAFTGSTAFLLKRNGGDCTAFKDHFLHAGLLFSRRNGGNKKLNTEFTAFGQSTAVRSGEGIILPNPEDLYSSSFTAQRLYITWQRK